MTQLWLVLGIKSTVVLLIGVFAGLLLRNRSAEARHLVWYATLCSLLILPFGLVIPEYSPSNPLTFRTWSVAKAGSTVPAGQKLAWMTSLWAVGCAVLGARTCRALLAGARLLRRARTVSFVGSHRVCIVDGIPGPVAWSFGAGAVLLPAEAEHWDADGLQSVIRHERAHLLRSDSQALLVSEVACALFWFHPLVWFVRSRMRVEQEHAADDYVLASGCDPATYASDLIRHVRAQKRQLLFAGAGLRSTLRERVEAVLDAGRRRSVLNRKIRMVSLACAIAFVMPLAGLQSERKVYKIGDGVTAPQVVTKEEPEYTQQAKDAKIEGSVLLSVVIEADGRASDIGVVRSLDDGLDANAVSAVQRWVFRPAEKDGSPVAVSARIEVNYRLK